MSDTSRPPDTFYVSNSLIKQHPREWDRGVVKYACMGECVQCVCARLNFRCLNCQVRFWDSDLRTARFSHTSCSAIYRFLLWQSTSFLVDCQSKVEVFFFFFKHWILKESKVRKWNSLQWGVLPAKEWGGVRILNYCRCALLKKKEKEKSSFIYFFPHEMSSAARRIR